MLENPPQAVLFDMDGLMLDTEAVYCLAWQRSAAEFGHTMTDEHYLSFVGRRAVDCHDILYGFYGHDFPLPDFLRRGCEIYEEYFACHGVPHKQGLGELLDTLDELRIPKAIATSTERPNALFCLGDLAGRFEEIVTGDEVPEGKPAPDIFLLAARRLNTAPARCLVLEDAEPGVRAAGAAGIPVIVVPDLKPPSPLMLEIALGVCDSLHDVATAIRTSAPNTTSV